MTVPRIAAHRGASAHAPENSLAAMRRAVTDGADGAEFDVHAAADGTLVVHHDAVVPGLGPIGGLTWSALAEYRLPNGEPLPRLPEVLAALPGRTAWIEVKALPPAYDGHLLDVIDTATAPAAVAVHSFDHRIIARLKRRRPALSTGALQASYPVDPLAAVRAAGADTLWQHWELIDDALVRACRDAGLALIAWTVPDEAAAGLASMGVDVLCGNAPDRLRRAIVSPSLTLEN